MKYRVKTLEAIFNLPDKGMDNGILKPITKNNTHDFFLRHKEWWGRLQNSKFSAYGLGRFYDFEIEEQWEE